MKSSAIDHAEERLRRAKASYESLLKAKNFQEAEDAWSDFLLAANTIYSKLEQGAKVCNKSKPWYGQKKAIRRKDPLLSYLHYARNTDEHAIARVTECSPGSQTLYIKPVFGERRLCSLTKVDQITLQPEGLPVDAIMDGPRLKCVRANDDRYGDFRDPPDKHLGKPIFCPEAKDILGGTYPDILAAIMITYLEKLISEARQLPAS